jgi:hypothetical protein
LVNQAIEQVDQGIRVSGRDERQDTKRANRLQKRIDQLEKRQERILER